VGIRRGPSRPLLAIAATLVVLGLLGSPAVLGGHPTPTPSPSIGLRPLTPGIVVIPQTSWLGQPVASSDQQGSFMQLTVPAGWTTDDQGRVFKADGTAPAGMGIEIGTVSAVYADPCHWTKGIVDIEAAGHGPAYQGVQGLANALAGNGAAPEATTLADYPGYNLTLTTPLDLQGCDSGQEHLWRSIDTGSARAHLPGQIDQVALLDTGVDVIVIDAWLMLSQPPAVTNGWIAFTTWGDPPTQPGDIYLVQEGQPAHRIIGSDGDNLDQRCPAFSPSGMQLAYGQATGSDTAGHSDATLVIADIDSQGNATTSAQFPVGGTFDPPCAFWSPDGLELAFAIAQSVSGADGPTWPPIVSEVRVIGLRSGRVTNLPVTSAGDLEWSPDGQTLAVANGGLINLYPAAGGDPRTLSGTDGATQITWSPDGRAIAYERDLTPGTADLVVYDVATGEQRVLDSDYQVNHGIGPVWSPDGSQLLYQRVCQTRPDQPSLPCREQHDVVILSAGQGESWQGADLTTTVMPESFQLSGATKYLWPYSVSWSPDGQDLLYNTFDSGLVVVPTSPGATPTILPPVASLSANDMGLDTPTQTWGRQP